MKIFVNATIKLAGWYLIILMAVSLSFSVIIYQITRAEVETSFERFISRRIITTSPISPPSDATREQIEAASANILAGLGYLNLIVLLAGGAGAYLLARHTLRPIEEAHEAQSRFVSNASHQLRTPLAIMKAETELVLKDKQATKLELKDTLASNLEEVNHLTRLSSMLLNLSLNRKPSPSSNEKVDLVSTVNDLIDKRQMGERVKLTVPKNLNIHGNEVIIREIYTVLIDNAIQHSPEKTPIHINLSSDKNSATLTIKNSTKGISKKQLHHIFERFYRADNSAGGYGLGLSLAKQLTESVDGRISASAKSKNITFAVTLPSKFS